MSLAVTPSGSSPSTVTARSPPAVLGQALRGQHELDLGGADAEGQRAEGAVRGRVGIAADDHHPGLGEAELRADDVDDALAAAADPVERDALPSGSSPPAASICLRERSSAAREPTPRRDVVVHGGHGQIGPAHLPAGQAQAFERLRGGDLMDEVEVDIQEVGLARLRPHDVGVPELLGEGLGLGLHVPVRAIGFATGTAQPCFGAFG